MRQIAPRTTGAYHIEDGIHHCQQTQFQRSSRPLPFAEQIWFDHLPLFLRQITGVSTLRVRQCTLLLGLNRRVSAPLFYQAGIFKHPLSGSIPSEPGNLAELKWLYLEDNELSGEIPSKLVNLVHLQGFSLSENRVRGCGPVSWSRVAHGDIDDVDLPFCIE